MTTLSSDVLDTVQFSSSPGAQQKSVGRAVCPESPLEVPFTLTDKTYLHGRRGVPEGRLPDRQVFALLQSAKGPKH